MIERAALVSRVVALVRRRRHGGATPGARRGWEAFRLELARSRRFGHPVALVRIPAPTATSGGGVNADFLVGDIRVVDSVFEDAGDLYLVLPHASHAAAVSFVDRLAGDGIGGFGQADARVVSFPEDGLTEDVLLTAVHAAAEPPTPIRSALSPAASTDEDVVAGGG